MAGRMPRHGARSDQFDEFVRADAEAAVGIHVPNETQRVAPLGCRSRARRRNRLCASARAARQAPPPAARQPAAGGAGVVCRGSCGAICVARSFVRPLRHREDDQQAKRPCPAAWRRRRTTRCPSALCRRRYRFRAPWRQAPRCRAPTAWSRRQAAPGRGVGINERAVRRESGDGVPAVGDTGGARVRRASACGPAGSVAAISTAALPSPRTMREQAQVSARPKTAPKPRSRSSRSCAADGSVAARRMICAAEVSLAVEAALPCRPRFRGAEDRRADRIGPQDLRRRRRSTAKPATRLSRAPRAADRRNSASSLSTIGMRVGTRILKKFLIVRAVRGVHGGGGCAAELGGITLIAPGA